GNHSGPDVVGREVGCVLEGVEHGRGNEIKLRERLRAEDVLDCSIDVLGSVGGVNGFALARCLWGGGVGADDIDRLAMAVDMVGAVLRIVFFNKDGRLRPDLTVTYRVDDAAQSEIVVCLVVDGIRMTLQCACGVIVGKPKDCQVGNLVRLNEPLEVVEPVVDTVLVRDGEIERRIVRIHDLRGGGDRRAYFDGVVWNDA